MSEPDILGHRSDQALHPGYVHPCKALCLGHLSKEAQATYLDGSSGSIIESLIPTSLHISYKSPHEIFLYNLLLRKALLSSLRNFP